ncbi:HD domain-containing protein [Oribacterium sp. WCC10]|uniref:HD domain-containing protein n=1 Tax=Oribacterium sp. WCC10 TaxID=1855343 RepID=UPI0008EBA5BC|nr:HD domain-containing protein [Oribacterium sp. WCC10]SFG54178.1 myo-inositol-1(or 4)-monophosphatase [Oribacterium sp. WCC10]
MSNVFIGKRYQDAMQFAAHAHRKQMRKGADIPYIVHPIECSMIVSSITDDEDVIIAALLHDVIEDTEYGYDDICERFGVRVANLVQNETEDKRNELSRKHTWSVRKKETIDHLSRSDRDSKIICLGDKLSNIRASIRDYESNREEFWQRFNQTDPDLQGWYYESIRDILSEELSETDAWREYDRLCTQMFGKLDLQAIESRLDLMP